MLISEITGGWTKDAHGNEAPKNRNIGGLPYSTPTQPYLYHGTSILSLINILKSNQLLEGAYWGKENEPHGVRTSRSPKLALNFAHNAGEYPFGAVLVLDWKKLAKQYKTVAYQDTMYGGEAFGNEEEEVVLTRAIKPLSAFLVKVIPKIKFYKDNPIGHTGPAWGHPLDEDWLEYAVSEGGFKSAQQFINGFNTYVKPYLNNR